MDRFVCVRLVQANSLDLALFQFDYDLTFAAFFMRADRTIYGRFGSRSEQKDADKDISIEGFQKAMTAALELHKRYPANKQALAGKQGSPPRYAKPEDYPSLQGRYRPKLDYEGKLVQSCLHCHQVREAERQFFHAGGKPIPDEVLYPWPMPDLVGLALDPKEMAKVQGVVPHSPAAKAGFEAGDEIRALQDQPLLSIADVQWVLHRAGAPATLDARVLRGGRPIGLSLRLAKDWRRDNDISWRATTWDLRRMATGGLVLKELPEDQRRQARLSDRELALLVDHVGQYGEHAAGKQAGFQKGDIIVSVDGRTDRMSESGLFGLLLQSKQPGDRVPMTVLRKGKREHLELPMQ